MADKSFGLKQINMIGVGTPTVESSTDLIVNTNGSERVRIESGGNIGIGTDFARTELDVRGDIWINRSSANGQPAHFSNPTQLLVQHTSAPNVYLIHGQYKTTIISGERLGAINFASNAESSGNGTPVVGASIVCEAQQSWTSSFNPGELIFRTNSGSSSAPTDAVGITSEGNIKIYRSGAGIDFSVTDDSGSSGTTNVSELLDDYEEGDWIPTMFGSTTAGTTTYTHQTGHYTKIGNRVIVSGTVAATTSGASGDLRIGNFPFVAGDESVGTFQANELSSWQSGVEQYSLIIQTGNSFCTFRGTKQAAAFVTLQIQNVTYLRFDVSYQTNS